MPYSSMSVEQAGIEWFIGTGAPIQVRLFTCNEIAPFQENQAAISSPNGFKYMVGCSITFMIIHNENIACHFAIGTLNKIPVDSENSKPYWSDPVRFCIAEMKWHTDL